MHTMRISRIEEGAEVLLLAFPVERYLAVIVQQALRIVSLISNGVTKLAKCHGFYYLKMILQRIMAHNIPLHIHIGHHKEDIAKILGGVASYKARIDSGKAGIQPYLVQSNYNS